MILIKDASLKYKLDKSTLAKYCRNKQIGAARVKIKVDAKAFMKNKKQLTYRSAWLINEDSLVDFLCKNSNNDLVIEAYKPTSDESRINDISFSTFFFEMLHKSTERFVENSYQVGGEHYKKLKYQPWDFIMDHNIPFALGLAIKYVIRHREKNGKNDLAKAIHCIKKAQERKFDINSISPFLAAAKDGKPYSILFFQQFGLLERDILKQIFTYSFNDALQSIERLIESEYSKS
jgi:hypothetical protein